MNESPLQILVAAEPAESSLRTCLQFKRLAPPQSGPPEGQNSFLGVEEQQMEPPPACRHSSACSCALLQCFYVCVSSASQARSAIV